MPIVKSEYSCPTCKVSGKSSQIVANAGELLCSVDGTHKWNDTATFLALKPTMDFKVAPATFLPQTNHAPITVTIPIGLRDALATKFGDTLNATVAGLLSTMIEGQTMIVSETDLQRIAEKMQQFGLLGKQEGPQNSSHLYGLIFALTEKINEYKLEAENATRDLKAYEGLSPGSVVVNLGANFQNAVDRARGAELPLKVFVERNLATALENNWF